MSDERTWREALDATARLSRLSLDKIGEGDWTPQDSAHWRLVRTVEELLDDPLALLETRVYHGDAA